MKISFDYAKSRDFFTENEFQEMLGEADDARETLLQKKGAGAEFTGWVDLPENYGREEFSRIQKAALKIQENSKTVLVIGIGGSYLGAAAATKFLLPQFVNRSKQNPEKGVEVYYVGNNLSGAYIQDIINSLGDRDFSIIVISKSGTTTEPAIAFRIFKEVLEKKYGEGAKERIYAITDAKKGSLKELADREGYEMFVVPDDIGGRYSVLTPVGLLPIACAGIDIQEMMDGAREMRRFCMETPAEKNDALLYAAMRNIFLRQGKNIEILEAYDPRFRLVAEWWKQLFGESEGKDGKGLFPASLSFTRDLHSVGQYIQDGQRTMFETVIDIQDDGSEIEISEMDGNGDGLNYLAGMNLQEINRAALKGTMVAHLDGGVPNLLLTMEERTAESLGQLFYFFEFACAVSAYILGVNPFDQPGVESYKKNMFALLGKPGYEEAGEELRKRI